MHKRFVTAVVAAVMATGLTPVHAAAWTSADTLYWGAKAANTLIGTGIGAVVPGGGFVYGLGSFIGEQMFAPHKPLPPVQPFVIPFNPQQYNHPWLPPPRR
jgi:hypothetical protein